MDIITIIDTFIKEACTEYNKYSPNTFEVANQTGISEVVNKHTKQTVAYINVCKPFNYMLPPKLTSDYEKVLQELIKQQFPKGFAVNGGLVYYKDLTTAITPNLNEAIIYLFLYDLERQLNGLGFTNIELTQDSNFDEFELAPLGYVDYRNLSTTIEHEELEALLEALGNTKLQQKW